MQIKPIQNTNNNVNFQGLHGNKKMVKKFYEFGLDKGWSFDKCIDRFEVLITTSKTNLFGQVKEFFVQAGESIKKNEKGTLELSGAKSVKLAFDSDGHLKEGNYGPGSMYFFRELVNDIVKTSSSEKLKNLLLTEKVKFSDMESYSASTLKDRLNDKDMEEVAKFYTDKMIKTVDKDGNTPLHESDIRNIRIAKDLLEDFPEMLTKLLLTKNKAGEFPTDGRNFGYSIETEKILYDIATQLRSNPRALITIVEHKPRTFMNSSVVEKLNAGGSPYQDSFRDNILAIIREAKDTINFNYGKFVPVMSPSEFNVAKDVEKLIKEGIDINKILKISRMSDVKNTKGLLLNNTDFANKTIDFILNEASLDDKQMAIGILKNLPDLSFDKVDDMGISILEKIINSENFSLLDLVKDKNLTYYPELDDAYKQVCDESFKRQLSNLDLNFVDLKKAIKAASMEALRKLDFEFKSPFYHRKTTGREIYDTSREDDTYEMWFYRDFCDKYKKYLYTQYDERDEKAVQKPRGWWE